MYLSRLQYEKIGEAISPDHSGVPKEMMDFFIDNGLIERDLFQYRLTEKGGKACTESRHEHELQKADNRTGPAEKGDFFRERRTSFTNNDSDLEITKKHSMKGMNPRKAKPETKYKDIK